MHSVANYYGFPVVETYTFDNPEQITEILQTLSGKEGFVVEFADGQRFKFKGEEYKQLHKILSGLTFNRVLEAYKAGNQQVLLETVPEEFLDMVQDWVRDIDNKVSEVYDMSHYVYYYSQGVCPVCSAKVSTFCTLLFCIL